MTATAAKASDLARQAKDEMTSAENPQKLQRSDMKILLVVDQVKDWKLQVEGVRLVSSTDYLTNADFQDLRSVKIYNLCRSYAYQESGYYVSLLATARKHVVVPSVSTILEMRSQSLLRIRSNELDDLIQKSLKDIRSDEFSLSIYFGKNLANRYDKLTKELHKVFHAPLLRARFAKKDKWRLTQITPIGLKEVPDSHYNDLESFASQYFLKRTQAQKNSQARFSLAILLDDEEANPPSDRKAIRKFQAAAQKIGIETEIIDKDDIGRLAEFDGLFIRVTTAVNHYTYRFAAKAQALGLVVIDDPESILRCTNKVYMAEMFLRRQIPAPKTTLIHKGNMKEVLAQLGLPVVLKQPDSSFSQGVIKVEKSEELVPKVSKMLDDSDLVVAQEFMQTDFDWRIGILNGKPLYACKYFMARNHWQIYKQGAKGNLIDGKSETLPIEAAPEKLVKLAKKAAAAIGNGLYGLDIKESQGKYYVIEINDNPSIDSGCEDEILKDDLYNEIMRHFLEKMEIRVRGGVDVP